ncbi:TLR13 [Mytilus coruscus]|uniref:TLR13 n=1 Tax=Mytilus coruscus TaxID=42192 RepID=A0A6J8D4N6_MYTCO|nr:TLR13 [Mytilus coruscus]
MTSMETIILVYLFGVISLTLFNAASSVECPQFCSCNSTTSEAKCQNKYYDGIPAFPNYITSLTYTGMNLPKVTRRTFEKLIDLDLQVLILRHNRIENITANALSKLIHLRHLDLSGNGRMNFTQLAACLENIKSPNITILHLNSFGWNEEQPNIYKAISRYKIQVLGMSQNNFKSLNMSRLGQYVPNLTSLNVAYNDIENIIPGQLKKLEIWRIHHNYVDVNNALFNSSGTCNFPSLKILNLTSNFVNYFENRFSCLEKLEVLVLDRNPVKKILKDTFVDLPSLQVLHLNHLGDRLYNIEAFPFRSKTLKELSFSRNHFAFMKSARYLYFNSTQIFRGIPNLEAIDLSENYFDLSDGILPEMISHLTNLTRITIKSCKFQTIPFGIFSKMKRLEVLNLTKNHIISWNGTEVFGSISSLKTLRLNFNYINVFNDTSFPESLMANLTSIDLAGNPFFCSCKNLWFRKWIHFWRIKRPSIFKGYPANYLCINPPELHNTELKNYFPSDDECYPEKMNATLQSFIVLSLIGIFGVILVSLIYKGRWHIRYCIYLQRVKQRGYISLNSGDSFLYSGFVVYSDEDRHWVFSKFLKIVEEENDQTLCIHHRDFEVGKLIVDNIADCIAQSKKIILVLSRTMMTSDWCLFETRLAQRKFLNDDTGSLIIIMLENIQKKDMPHSLRELVDLTTYITWSEEPEIQDRFWTNVLKSIKGGNE